MALSPHNDPFHLASIFRPIIIEPREDHRSDAEERQADQKNIQMEKKPEADSREDSTGT